VTEDVHYETALRRWNTTRRRRDPITGKHAPLTGADRIDIETAAARLRAAENPAPEVDEICGLTELAKTSCSHCRPRLRRPIEVDGRPRLFTARFPGTCAGCDQPYPAGVTIERLDGGGYACPDCANRT
jgi:hypothetical protein